MFWPKNQERYVNLKSSFVDFHRLLEDLGEVEFSGFLEMIFKNDRYYILKQPDQVEKVYLKEERSGRFLPAEITLPEIQARSSEETTIINVFDVDPDQLEFLSGCLNAQPLYSNLSSEFTDFEKLLNKLSKDEHHGYLEVSFQDSPMEPAYIFYRKGQISSVFFRGEQYKDHDEGIRNINEKLGENEAKFNVYQIVDRLNPTNELPDSGVQVAALTPDDSAKKTMETSKAELAMEPVEILGESPESQVLKEGEHQEVVEKQIETSEETMLKSRKSELEELSVFPYLDFVEALIRWVEEAVNRYMGKNYFSKAFKKGLLNISDKYPFLDPFLADFTYADGKINFTSEAKAIEFLKGIYDAIETLFEEFTLKERENIQRQLKQTLRNLERNHHENIEILRVRTLMPTLFQ